MRRTAVPVNIMKITVVGALGRMGVNVITASRKFGHECYALVDPNFEGELGNGCYRDIFSSPTDTDVIIDFSFHGATPDVVKFASDNNIPAVIATTGHTEAERGAIMTAASKAAIFYSGNMSLGIATLCSTVKKVVSVFPHADVEIIETHHNRKLDAPSGTALMLFNSVKEARPSAYSNISRSSGKRDENEVGISAVRCGNIVGIHEVRICTDFEQITLKHEAFDRALFADGAITAAEYLIGKEPMLYDMNHLMKGII